MVKDAFLLQHLKGLMGDKFIFIKLSNGFKSA